MKHIRLLFIAFGSIPGLFAASLILACWGEPLEYPYFHFYNPQIVHSQYSSFYRATDKGFYDGGCDPQWHFENINVVEWAAFFKQSLSREEVNTLLYRSTFAEIDTLIFRMKDSRQAISVKLSEYSIMKYPDRRKAISFLVYLGFAKQCEPFVVTHRRYGEQKETPAPDTAEIHKLIRSGMTLLKHVKDPIIASRYRFQITRLYFYAGEYQACIAYNRGIPQSNVPASMKYRMLGYVAGAHYRLKEYARANYMFSRIFDAYKPMRKIACFSFRPREETDWRECLSMARSKSERMTLWALLGVNKDGMRAMKEIYAIDPKSPYLDLLLTRAINVEEESFLRVPGENGRYENTGKSWDLAGDAVDSSVAEFIAAIAKKGNTANPFAWCLAAGYLQCAQSHRSEAMRLFNQAMRLAGTNSYYIQQVKKFRLIAKVAHAEHVDATMEEDICEEFAHIEASRYDDDSLSERSVFAWMKCVLAEKYIAQGDVVKAQCLYPEDGYQFYTDPRLKASMLALMDGKTNTRYEKLLLRINPIKKRDIYGFDCIRLFQADSVQQALATLNRCPGSGDNSLEADPFTIHNLDNHDRDRLDLRKKVQSNQAQYATSYDLVKKVCDYQRVLRSHPANASEIMFMIGNVFYNITYFGNARQFYVTPVCAVGEIIWPRLAANDAFVDAVLDCSIAEKYYRAACDASCDPEFKAKCLFMAAKCERNAFYVHPPKQYKGDFKAGVYFHRLKNEFNKTQYYQEIIRECGYFKTFVSKN